MAQSSLAQQLSKLRVAQKDEIQLPQRTRVSFLFDIKQAANIDDQTLYYICLGGIRDLSVSVPELASQLQSYQTDLLSEKSLEFYRGTQTKDILKHIESQLKTLIEMLAPYFLESATHRIIEYLIRIYEIHAFHKHTLIYSFLPYFETSFFLRMIQLLNIKEDELLFFLEPYAYKGEQIDIKSLVKGLQRNNGTLFTKYSEFCFHLSQLHQTFTQNVDNCLHWKFFGTMLVEVLRTQNDDQTLLFNLLPFISQGIKSSIKDLKLASLMGISQLACRKTLTPEYAQAFFKLILIAIANAYNNGLTDKDVERFIIVMVLLSQFQRIQVLSKKETEMLLRVPQVSKHLANIGETHDLTFFMNLLSQTALQVIDVNMKEIVSLLKPCLNLKITYSLLETTLSLTLSNTSLNSDRCHQLLTLLKQANESDFNQAILYLMKQSNEGQKEQIVELLLQGKDKGSNLISKFGEKEYSLLSSLGSQSKVTRVNAIQALLKPEFAHKLSLNERDLVKLTLSQLILRNTEEELILAKIIDAYISLIDIKHASSHDIEFDILQSFLNSNINTQRYTQDILDTVISCLVTLKVSHERQETQLILALSFDKIHHVPSQYHIGNLNKANLFMKNISKDFKLGQSLLLAIIKNNQKWVSPNISIELLSNLIEQNIQNEQLIEELYIKVCGAFKLQQRSIEKELKILIQKMRKSCINQDKVISKIIGICIQEKQRNKDFDVGKLIQIIFDKIFNSSQQKIAEFFIQLAIESKNDVKKVFSIISLTHIIKSKPFNPQFMMILSLILLQDQSKLVRTHSINLIEVFQQVKDEGKELQIFTDTMKPKSAKKPSDRQEFTPIKIKPIQSLFKSILQLKNEIISDRGQVSTALNNSSQFTLIDSSIRFILDLPTITMRSIYLQSLLIIKKYSIVFAMTLSEYLTKEYFLLRSTNLFHHSQLSYLSSIGSLLQRMTHPRHNDAPEEFLSSLAFPFLSFLFSIFQSSLPIDLEIQVVGIFCENIFQRDLLQKLKSEHKTQIIKLYIQSQQTVYSKVNRQGIRDKLIEECKVNNDEISSLRVEEVFNEKELKPIIKELSDKIQTKQAIEVNNLSQIEIVMETLIQVRVQNEVNMIQLILDIITKLSSSTDQNVNVFYLIELCVQLCIQIVQTKQKFKVSPSELMKKISDILSSQVFLLKNHISQVLSAKNIDQNDPFQQFIMEVDEDGSKKQPSKDNLTNEQIQAIMQVISSLSNFQIQMEINLLGSNELTNGFLSELAKMIVSAIEDERSRSVQGTKLTLQMFRFYHQLVTKSIQLSNKDNFDLKELISTYVDTLLKTEKINAQFDEIYNYLNIILKQNTNKVSFVSLVLLSHGKDSITVKDNLELESTEIKLVQRLLIDSSDILSLIENLIFFTSSLQLQESSDNYAKQRLSLLFDQNLIQNRYDITNWIYYKYINGEKESRRLKYLIVYLINDWISKNQIIQRKLAYLTKEDQESSLKLFYQLYLSSSVLNETISHTLQNKEQQSDKKAKKSLKRLHSRIQEFQRSLNNLLSYEVQVSIVNKVLEEFKDVKQTINMRTITLQLLINKTPQFAQSLSKVQEKEMVIIFTPLIQNVLGILTSILKQLGNKANQEKQNFLMALLSLVQRIISTILPKNIKEKILTLILGLNDLASTFSMMLHSQLILTSMTLFEVYQLDILEHLQRYFNQLVSSFERLSSADALDFFVDSYTRTLLKSSLSISTFFSKFLSATQYESLIKHVLVITDPSFDHEIKPILDVISIESTKNVGFKLIFQAMINSYDEVIISNIANKEVKGSELSVMIIRFFDQLFKQVIQRIKKEFVVDNHKKIFEFFKNAFGFTYRYQKERAQDIERVREIEESIAKSYEQFVIKMNEEQLRPLIVRQVKWAFKVKGKVESPFPYNMHKSIVFFRTVSYHLTNEKFYRSQHC